MSKKLSSENILDDVSKDFEDVIESILKTGLDEANKIIEESSTKSKNEEHDIESQQSKEFDIKSRQIIGTAEMESRNSNLLLLEKNINKVFSAALKELSSDKGKNYPKSLELFINEGLDSIDESEIIKSGIRGMLKSLDPYTLFLSGSSKDRLDMLRTGKYGGVGIRIGLRRDTFEITIKMTFKETRNSEMT